MIRPKKHLGQHFLKDHNIAQKISDSISVKTHNLIEIGPGTGILTKYLADLNFPVFYMIEIDPESVSYLQVQFPGLKDKIIQDDFLRFDLSSIFKDKFSVVGNFPYNVSSQILFRVLEYRTQVAEVVGMFQKEVAERISAKAGSKKYGILSVLVQAYYEIEYLFTVSEKVFFPEPKVKSAVIRLTRNEKSSLDCDEKLFFRIVKTAFNQRRKILRNSLHEFDFEPFENLKVLLTKRAEQLDVLDFVFLTNHSIQSAKIQ
jgi:16S rRNA (adenine1518-N6/adenine1519-N6)-dimethyltransferase